MAINFVTRSDGDIIHVGMNFPRCFHASCLRLKSAVHVMKHPVQIYSAIQMERNTYVVVFYRKC